MGSELYFVRGVDILLEAMKILVLKDATHIFVTDVQLFL